MRADNSRHLVQAADMRKRAVRSRAERALATLQGGQGAPTIRDLCQAAGVSRSWLYTQPDLLERLRLEPSAPSRRGTDTALQRQLIHEVRTALAVRGWTQAMLSARTGFSPKHINQMLQGRVEGSLAAWQVLLDTARAAPGGPTGTGATVVTGEATAHTEDGGTALIVEVGQDLPFVRVVTRGDDRAILGLDGRQVRVTVEVLA